MGRHGTSVDGTSRRTLAWATHMQTYVVTNACTTARQTSLIMTIVLSPVHNPGCWLPFHLLPFGRQGWIKDLSIPNCVTTRVLYFQLYRNTEFMKTHLRTYLWHSATPLGRQTAMQTDTWTCCYSYQPVYMYTSWLPYQPVYMYTSWLPQMPFNSRLTSELWPHWPL